MLKLTDKVAIITGGNSGIGEAAAKLFAKQGAAVVLVARRADKLTAVADEIAAAGGKALAIPADVTDPATAVKVCEETVKQFGKIDILVNSAGEGDYTRPITGVTDEFFDHIVKVDQYAVFYMCREVVKYMQSAHSGSIVNISSVGGVFHNSGFAYAAAKSAVIGMTRNMAMQFAAEGIRVNAVCPGGTKTPMIEATTPTRCSPATRSSPGSLAGTSTPSCPCALPRSRPTPSCSWPATRPAALLAST